MSRLSHRVPTIAVALAGLAGAIPATAQTPPELATPELATPELATEVEEVTVTARRPVATLERPGPVSPDPFTVFRDYCFEPNRLRGRSARPVGDPAWAPLDGPTRLKLNITDPSAVALGRLGAPPEPALTLRIEERRLRGLVEHRCALTVAGATDGRRLQREMSALFSGGPTQRHIDDPRADYPRWPGWRQWLWTAIPARGSKDWKVFRASLRSQESFVLVTQPSFYRHHAYVAGDLRIREDPARPASILSVTHTYRP